MTTNRYCRGIAVAIAALTLASAAHASSIAIFNTGVDVSGTPLANGTIGDPHYALVSVPGLTTSLLVRTSAGGFPVPPWVADNGTSAWVGPNNDSQADGPVGIYDYQTTFDLTGLNPDTAFLSGLWAMDNEGFDILINGVSTHTQVLDPSSSGAPFMGFNSFSISSGFTSGLNTLDFIVNNLGGPTGLRVEVSGTANTPEPASLVLFGAGFAGLFLLRRKLGWAARLQ